MGDSDVFKPFCYTITNPVMKQSALFCGKTKGSMVTSFEYGM